MKLWLLHIGALIFFNRLAGFFLELFSNPYFSPTVHDLIFFQSRISGNVMTLTGVCKGLSIIAFLAGLRFYNIFSLIGVDETHHLNFIADFTSCQLGRIQKRD